MYIIILIILSTLIIDFSINVFANFLNLKNMKKTVPKEFTGIYNHDQYKKSQKYLKAYTKFGVISSIFDIILFLGFWFLKGFPFLDNLVRAWNFGNISTGILYIGILVLLKTIICLPLVIYSTFIIEQKFGFNKTTPFLFAVDLIKSFVISGILGVIFLGGILCFFEYAGNQAWLMCWLGSTIFFFAVQYIVPNWILPIFNKFTPLENSDLRNSIIKYAKSINFSLDNIFVMDGSKRSTKSNAFFVGFGKNKRIVLFDTLIKKHTIGELVAILAHEMGHFKKKHILKRLVIGIFQMGLIFFLMSLFISYQGLFDAFFMEQKSIYAGLIFFSIIYSSIDFFISIIMKIISRKDEYEADKFAVQTIENKKDIINALKKLSAHNLSNLFPHDFYVFLNYSHPSILDRIKTIRTF
ncbi:MAG: peptidase M48 [Desulfobacteraceae bacterium 4572_130]|nr:MAG: peptidase M48 [Desulfobacteraceae bacterium 4572_130]